MKKGKILILGAHGMLGRELLEVFQNYNPIGWDKDEIDITDNLQVKQKISELKPEVVINAAAYTDVDDCEKNKELALKVNGNAVGYLAEICKEINAVLIHYSTDYVFYGDNEKGYNETDEPANPVNVYGQSKLLGEKLLREKSNKYYLIRTSWLFGRYGKNFVDTILRLAKEKNQLKIVNDQYGKATYALDLAKRTKEILESEKSFGIYHITNEGIVSWYDFAKKILETADINKEIKPCFSKDFPTPAERPRFSILINTKVPLMRKWEETLKDYLSVEI